ncbi:MAG: hypothetical protein II859_08210 [Bacteroidales bacterium]|nr:hypothetical protein [Bacteroidales bacterium]
MITINIPSSYCGSDDNITQCLTHLPHQIGQIRGLDYYVTLKQSKIKNLYERRAMPIPEPTLADIQSEIRALGKIYKGTPSVEDILSERKNAWRELYAFHNNVEDKLEEQVNLQFNDEYVTTCKQIDKIIAGPKDIVEKELKSEIQNIKVPCDVQVKVHYSQKEQLAVLNAVFPWNIPIPTIKKVSHSRGTSVKDKLQREIHQEETECIIGMAFLMGGKAFAASPNIKTAVVAISKQTQYMLAVHLGRVPFCQEIQYMDVPSKLINLFPFLADIRTVRNAMVMYPVWIRDFEAFDARLSYVL